MFTLILGGALLTLLIGVIAKAVLDKQQHELRITGSEFGIASAVMLVVVIPLTVWIGFIAAKTNQLTFYENLGGFEISAERIVTQCERDGMNVKHSYKGDPYQYVWYEEVDEEYQVTVTDDKGKSHTVTRHRKKKVRHEETRYHDIPYCTEEWTFVVKTTLGDFTIADRNLPTNPNNHRYRWGVSVPDSLPSGIPPFWADAKERIDHDDNGPVTVRNSYTNYILASQTTILRRFNDSIEDYQKKQLLPKINAKIHSFYYSDRVYFAGNVLTHGNWQAAINRFNAALGSNLQGDLHLVIVDAKQISNPDNYAGALIAYWQSNEFGKDAFSKNGILLILGTSDGTTIDWARAHSGMPLGNEALLLELRNSLPKQMLDPNTLLGHPTAISFSGKKVDVQIGQSVLEKIFWGKNKFKRVHMNDHEGETPGFSYLVYEIEPTAGQKVLILLATLLFSAIAWGICIGYGAPHYRQRFH